MTQRVEHAVDAAIATARVDLEAPDGERVRFEPAALAALLALAGDDLTRARVLALLRQRLSVAILAMEPHDVDADWVDADWHDAQAVQGLLNHVEGPAGRR